LPAIRAGKTPFSVAVKDVVEDLVSQGFPPGNIPQVCSALRKKEFLRSHGIEIESVEGPPSKMSTTVVYRYRLTNQQRPTGAPTNAHAKSDVGTEQETPEQWAHRVTGKLCGLMKDEIAAMGGGEAFLRWARGYDE